MNYVKRVLTSKLVHNGMWMLALKIFNTILPILTIPYITRVLTKADYGEFAIASSWITYFQVIVEYGFALTGAKKAAMRKSDTQLSDIRNNIISARLFLFVITLFIALVMLIFLPVEKSLKICFITLFIIIFSLVFQHNWLFQGVMEMRTLSIISALSRLISTILIFIFIRDTEDLYLYCFLTALGSVLTSLVGSAVANKKYSLKFEIKRIASVFNELKDGWSLFISSAVGSVFGSIGVTVLGILATNSEVATYSAINKIPYIMLMLFSAISQTLYPHSCTLFEKSFDYAVNHIKKIATLVVGLFSAFGIGICVFRNLIVKVAFGMEYAHHSFLIIPFVLWALLGMVNNFLGIQVLVASGHKKEYSNCFVISIIIMLILMFIFGHYFKAFGIAMASMCSELILTFMLTYYISIIQRKQKFNY